jgi:hypothetical protein
LLRTIEALPLASRVATPRSTVPLKKETVPEGVPAELVTWALKVTGCPNTGVVPDVGEVVAVVVVGEGLTV